MVAVSRSVALAVVLVFRAQPSYGSAIHQPYPYLNVSSSVATTTLLPIDCSDTSSNIYYPPSGRTVVTVSVSTTTTLRASDTPCYSNSTVSSSTTTTTIVPTYITTSTVPHHTTTTIVPSTITSSATYTSHSYTTTTIADECPSTCSISAGTVNLFFWPTNNDYSYPSTYVNTALDYTFTSPSVYMLINTIYGYNSLGRAGPAGTSEIFALNLDQVSTIVPGSDATRQLSLSDLGTDCPQSIDPSEIATKAPDGRCDPSLVAPDVVKSWALPCNACGKFGLFDPPYAVPTLTGGLIEPTITTVATTAATSAATGATSTAVPTTTTAVPATTNTPSSTLITTGTSTLVTTTSSLLTDVDPTTVVTAAGQNVSIRVAYLVVQVSSAWSCSEKKENTFRRSI
ncbi:uncharacterized protein JN550_013621 [Neoarthrinium moseri]|uniref:uncharacterized protein n=1 Tax=Neoarthrinium moseri TaxID=1658444 RepID=UPI001FDAF087|nr:uncharacterized protein JN550_013621 [Neoarthrinium moseri]KAI1856876.1 hypothetical protein JN550_013621 [Neoarthrinium moseri]